MVLNHEFFDTHLGCLFMRVDDSQRLAAGHYVLRPWRREDVDSLARHANNPQVAAELRNRFPHPYTRANAEEWIDRVLSGAVADWAIEVDGQAVGGVGLMSGLDDNAEAAEIGYWLGQEFWGRGIATLAVQALTRQALTPIDRGGLGYGRLFALVKLSNSASRRVLEKAGFTAEATLSRTDSETGERFEQAIYATVAESLAS